VVYRDALWDAHVEGEMRGEPGELLFIHAVDGSTLRVSKQKPA
jgi:membrane protein implicated in regulation of membrane protease activity